MTARDQPPSPDILVVDDTPANLNLLTALLKEAGYAVRAAPNPELALQSALAYPPALLLLDVRMPGMDGFEVCRRLKKEARTSEIPVIFVSGQHDAEDRVRGFKAGGVDFISKPFQREEILARVRTHLALRQAQNELELRVKTRTAELEESIRQLRETELAMDMAGIGICRFDAETGRILFINDYFCQAHGRKQEELLSMSMADIAQPPIGISFREQFEAYRKAGRGRFETLHRHKDGRAFPVEATFFYHPPQARQSGHFVSFMSDISLRKTAEDRMRQDREQQATLLHLLEATLGGDALEETLERCLDQLLSISWLSALPKGAVFLSDKNRQRLRLVVSRNLIPEIQSQCADIPFGFCLCGRAAADGEILFSSHVDTRYEVTHSSMHDHGHYCLPLTANGQVIGVLTLYLPKGASPEPGKERFLASVADILAGYISRNAGEHALIEHQAHLEAAVQERTADLKASEARTRAILSTMLDGVVHIDAGGVILSVNYAMHQIFGYAEEEMVGRNIAILMPEPHASAHNGYISRYLQTRQPHVLGRRLEVSARRKDGSLFPLEIAVNEMVDDTGSTFIGVLNDRTLHKMAELKLKQALQAAQAATEAKGNFLANMSHEIRTPLNAILGLAQIGMRDSAGGKPHETFLRLRDAGSHLLAVVNDILDFSKIEAGKLKVEKRSFALYSVIDNVRSFVAARAEEKGLALSVSLAPDLSDWVEGDSLRLAQILTNILSNAIKFTEHGEVILRAARDGSNIYFLVVDSGIGMTEKQLEHLFQAFEQADSSTTRNYGGTGLGLAISRNLARLMGGDISVDSSPGAGSSFTLRLPLPAAAPPAHPGKPNGVSSAAGPRLLGISALVADDVDINRFIMEDLLTHEGARVVFAHDGRQALDRLEESGVSAFDVVLMDVQMPVMDGFEATRRIAAIAPGLPVIGLTAHAMAEERDKCFAAGMVDHVIKPVDADTLIGAIRRHARPAPPLAPIVPASAAETSSYALPPGCQAPEIIDLAILSGRVGNDQAKIVKYVRLFLENARSTLAEMDAALETGDMLALGKLGHRLKSAALTVGAMRFGELCRELESFKENGELNMARARVAQLQTLLELITLQVKDVLHTENGSAT